MSKASQRRLAEKQKRLKAGGGSEMERILHTMRRHRKEQRSIFDDLPYWRMIGEMSGKKKPAAHEDDRIADRVLTEHDLHVKALHRIQRRLNADVGIDSDAWISMPGVVASGGDPTRLFGSAALSVFGQGSDVLENLPAEFVRRMVETDDYGLWVVGVQGPSELGMVAVAFTRSGAMRARVYVSNGFVEIPDPDSVLAILQRMAEMDRDREENQSRETLAVADGIARLAGLVEDVDEDLESVGAFLGEVLREVVEDGQFEYASCLWTAAAVMVADERLRRDERETAVAEAESNGQVALKVVQAEVARLRNLLELSKGREEARDREIASMRAGQKLQQPMQPGAVKGASLADRLAPFF